MTPPLCSMGLARPCVSKKCRTLLHSRMQYWGGLFLRLMAPCRRMQCADCIRAAFPPQSAPAEISTHDRANRLPSTPGRRISAL
jgi:hypothetical protein